LLSKEISIYAKIQKISVIQLILKNNLIMISRHKKLSVCFAFLLGMFFLLACQTKTVSSEGINNSTTSKTETKPTPPTNRDAITIAAGGDVMLGSTFPNETRMPPNDGADSLKAVAPIFQKADIAFANLEGPMVDSGVSTKCPPTSTKCFAFRVPTRYGKYLKEAGLDVMSLANNHAGDFGDNGRASTRQVLDSLGIKHAGSDRGQFAMTILEVKGKKVAFIGFAHNNIVPNVNDLAFARQLVQQATKKADLVVVSFHGGAEGAINQHVPQKTEIFFGEERGNLPLFARTVIDAGADLVLGHGPHVLRGMEIYKDRFICYSMGNFATYGWFQLEGATAETMVLEVSIDADGKFLSGKINPFHLEGRGILVPDSTKSAISTLRNLSNSDFPATAPKISDDGSISVK
jgi:poly-gamma-glutamate capsule biosynthesis protein CapA/YwtB (metallophosphatase superfamily)